ncbi:DNA topoisomerase IB [Roseobacter sinensis]|uniref:DNA topoisomerase n=1 Tax=Roseobacter sinensis TaxID=2931391 RepID=A0ABT3BGV2_9RHOB|nr:DNA topoisomerase IB [Roseobacter sp. WL0113]MCV3272765.1 DNA topoisomerase IB [Roseobacter sp. WL0113]
MPQLVYYPDDQPGISRRKCGRGFRYIGPDGTAIDDQTERQRLAALAVPPAYDDVWMCPLPNGHLLATGRDARQRKQYRYHPDWTSERAKTKFDMLADFGRRLPRIRRRVRRDLAGDAGAKRFALASAVTLIDRAALRVGSDEYVRENGSYGALTLRRRHVSLRGNRIKLDYTAKGGKRVRKQIADRTLARMLNKIGDLPGASLLTWLDDDGAPRTLSSQALNAYIASAAGRDEVTAKTFRTWAGTLAAFEVAQAGPTTIKELSNAAARRLHNTPSIARDSYIHPEVIALARGGRSIPDPVELRDLRAAEQHLLGLLDR